MAGLEDAERDWREKVNTAKDRVVDDRNAAGRDHREYPEYLGLDQHGFLHGQKAIRTMSDLEDAKKAWRERMDRIERRLNKTVVLDTELDTKTITSFSKTEALFTENSKKIAENRKGIAENREAIAKNRKEIAELKENIMKLVARMDVAMKWVPIKTGLWTTGMLLAVIVAMAKIPSVVSAIKTFLGSG
ncbi:hypothetical protein [Thioalkalivibrio sp. HK1]|uniref:hypothetical protein n=1 Tax=Thioalkalivibrio sp. HK1 TaxID=1469245 RepID=UPI0004703885|nr:hypothetical protein [Thioalkalivibrio sp. HK1]